MAQSDGKWEITLTVKCTRTVARYSKESLPPFDEKYTVEKPTLKEAIAEAIYQANKKTRSGNYRGVSEFKSSKTIRNPSGSSVPSNNPQSGTDVRGVAENIFTGVSATAEYANMLAEFKNLQKMVTKLGGVGKVFTGVSVGNDSIKLAEACFKLSNTTDKAKQKEIGWEIVSIVASLTRTAITIAFPPTAVVDAMFSVCCMINDKANTAMEKKMREKASDASVNAMKTLKAKYGKEPGALPIVHTGYGYEVELYCLGLSMAEIKSKREFVSKYKSRFSKYSAKDPYNDRSVTYKIFGL